VSTECRPGSTSFVDPLAALVLGAIGAFAVAVSEAPNGRF
jgi:hypothetical protein